MKLSQQFIFNNYPLEIQISQSRRETYFKKGDKIPKKHEGLLFEIYKKKEVLVDRWGVPVIKNSKTAGTPKFHRINGQDLYSLNILPNVKNNIVKHIKQYYNSFKYQYKVETDKIFIEYVFYSKGLESDLDNHALFYHKVFLDSIQKYVFVGRGEKELNSNYIVNKDTVDYVTGYSINYCKLNSDSKIQNCILINIYINDNQLKLEYLDKNFDKSLIYLI